MNVLHVNIHHRSIRYFRSFFFFFSVKNFRGNEEILILILWRRVVCTVKYSFGRSDFSGGAKVAQEGKKNREKSLKEGFR